MDRAIDLDCVTLLLPPSRRIVTVKSKILEITAHNATCIMPLAPPVSKSIGNPAMDEDHTLSESAAEAAHLAAVLAHIDRPIVLVGMMGVGKTSLGRRLAALLNVPFVDADDEIEKAAQMPIPIFSLLTARLSSRGRTPGDRPPAGRKHAGRCGQRFEAAPCGQWQGGVEGFVHWRRGLCE
jgi:hypothetical protein